MSEKTASSVTTPLRCGVVGVGHLGQHHARLYRSLPDCQLVGIYDTDPARAELIAQKLECKIFDSAIALAQESDVLSVVVPTTQHFTVALPLLEYCSLLVEKPLCATLDEAKILTAKAQETNRILQVGHIEHFNPVICAVDVKTLQPTHFEFCRQAPFSPRGADVSVIYDLMLHDLSLLLSWMDTPISFCRCEQSKILSSTADIADAYIEFENGCKVHLHVNRIHANKTRQISAFNAHSGYFLDLLNIKADKSSLSSQVCTSEPIFIPPQEPLAAELQSFAHCVTTKTTPLISGPFACKVLALVEQLDRSRP